MAISTDSSKNADSKSSDTKAEATVHAKPASQGDNPADRNDAQGVTPVGLGVNEVYAPGAAGVDPDSVARSAKHALAAPDPSVNEHADRQLEDAAKARRLVAERNRSADPARVEAIDGELRVLGFTGDLATTEVQRGNEGPAGRRAPDKSTG